MFASLSGEGAYVFPERFKDLKRCDRHNTVDLSGKAYLDCRQLIGDADNQARLRHSWATLTRRLAQLAPEIERSKQDVSPCSGG